jgi:HD-GYP domain-containing protein (c-di-GMP phosphodiesterase class II)
VGKIKVPIGLLEKKGPLAQCEREEVQKHVHYSVLMLKSMEDINKDIIEIVWSHHERYDATGYPRRLSMSQISTSAFISGLADSYEAMMSARPYRETKTSFQALMELYQQRDQAFPGGLIEQFIQCVGIFPVGSFVALNTKEVGVVVQRNRVQQLKPRVMILIDKNGNRLAQPFTVDLSAQHLLPSKTPRVIKKIANPNEYGLNTSEFFDVAS